jgi:hypothetical protein
MTEGARSYGLIAEMSSAEALLRAARAARDAGYRRVDAYAPFRVEGLAEAMGARRNRVALAALLGGVLGGAGTYFMQWYSVTVAYPLDIGGRSPYWPGFIPATFEMTVLGAALATFIGMLILNGLPKLNHPIFNAADFDLATRNRFFLCVESADPNFEPQTARAFLEALEPLRVSDVPF